MSSTKPEDAVARATSISPAFLQEVQDRPELLEQLSRAQAALVQHKMVKRLMEDERATIAQFATVHERLTKTANLTPQQSQVGAGQSITINFVRAPEKGEKVVIEGAGQTVAIPASTDVA